MRSFVSFSSVVCELLLLEMPGTPSSGSVEEGQRSVGFLDFWMFEEQQMVVAYQGFLFSVLGKDTL